MLYGRDYVSLVQLNTNWYDTISSDVMFTYSTYFENRKNRITKIVGLAKMAIKSKNIKNNLKTNLKKFIEIAPGLEKNSI